MTTPIVSTIAHRENLPTVDTAAALVRVKERREQSAFMRSPVREIVGADTDLIEALALEVRRLEAGNKALREILASIGKK